MTWSRKRWFLAAIVGVIVLIVGGVSLVIGTQAGTRWLLQVAEHYVPRELELGVARGTLLGGVRMDSLSWQDESVRVAIEGIDLNIELLPLFVRQVAIDEIKVQSVDIVILDTGESDDSGGMPDIELPIGLSVSRSMIENLTFQIGGIQRVIDRASLSARISGPKLTITKLDVQSQWLNLDIAGHVSLNNSYPGQLNGMWQLTQADGQRLAGELKVKGDMRAYEVQHDLAEPLSVSTKGVVSVGTDGWFADLRNQWQFIDLVVADRRVQSPGGALSLRGDKRGFAVKLDSSVKLDELPETKLGLEGDSTLESFRISSLTLANDLAQVAAHGHVSWAPSQSVDLEFDVSGVDPSVLVEGVAGVIELRGKTRGEIVAGEPKFELSVDRMGGSINGHPLTGDAHMKYSDDSLAIIDGHIQVGSNQVSVAGFVNEKLVLDVQFDMPKTGELAPGVSGSMSGVLNVDGPKDRPNARLELTGSALAWTDYSANTLSSVAQYSATGPSNATLTLEGVSIDEKLIDSVSLSVSGLPKEHNIRASLAGYGSQLELDANGGYSQARWAGQIESLTAVGNEIGSWSSRRPTGLAVSAENIMLSQLCLSGSSEKANACLLAEYQTGGLASFTVSVSELPITALPLELSQDVNLSGSVRLDGNGQLDGGRLSGDMSIELLDVEASTTFEGELVSVALSEAIGQATIIDNQLESMVRLRLSEDAGSADARLKIEDITDTQADINGSATLALPNAEVFGVFVPSISEPKGKLAGSVTIGGTLREPSFLGDIALSEGSFSVRPAGIEISNIDVRLRQSDVGRLQLVGSARSGEGQISIQGNTQVSAETGIRSEILLSGENFELLRLPDWQIAASPTISVVLDEKVARVTGELVIPTAGINLKAVPVTAEAPSPDATVHRSQQAEPRSGRRIDVDIKTILGNDVQLSGFGLTTGIEGAVNLKGGSHSPYTGFGRLSLRGGRYKAYGQELEIERGELIFNGPLESPNLVVLATRKVSDVTAGIRITGTPSELQSEVFSEPPLGDAEVLSYLLTGRPLASAASSGEGDALNNAAFALGLTKAGSVASQIRGQLGLETLTVEGGAESGRIVAGRRFGDRLLVEYGYGLVDKLGTLLLRYQLNDRFVLESRTGTVSNFDIVYRVKKR